MPFGLGFGETILIFAVMLLFFGPRRLPELGASLGKGIRDFRRSLNGLTEEGVAPAGQWSAQAAPAAPSVAALQPPVGAEPLNTIAPPAAEPVVVEAVAVETPAALPTLTEHTS
ncbi:MAG: twin-arginine translocase TatA/TatE family subunit [Gemmatimonadetes bacterium]|nr:twin-arginine translocase TatA/TatE family subunit [Gemmatimonadota bacterium]